MRRLGQHGALAACLIYAAVFGAMVIDDHDHANARTRAASWHLVPVEGTIRSDVPGVWTVVDNGTHYHQGIGSITCSGGTFTVHVSPAGDKDGAYTVSMDGVLVHRGVAAGLSVNQTEVNISLAQTDADGVHSIDCDDPAVVGGGSNIWLVGYQAVFS